LTTGWSRSTCLATAAPRRPPTLASYAEEVIALLDAHGIGLFSVVGLSFGGAVAQV
jgi:pimeloyl-ACP methyl ester carboxylesterase